MPIRRVRAGGQAQPAVPRRLPEAGSLAGLPLATPAADPLPAGAFQGASHSVPYSTRSRWSWNLFFAGNRNRAGQRLFREFASLPYIYIGLWMDYFGDGNMVLTENMHSYMRLLRAVQIVAL